MHEPKLDGWRCELAKSGLAIALYTRRDYDLASRARAFTQRAAAEIPEPRLLLDRELVAVGDDSRADFHAIATALRQQSPTHLFYFAFDVLVLGRRDLRRVPLEERREYLFGLLSAADGSPLSRPCLTARGSSANAGASASRVWFRSAATSPTAQGQVRGLACRERRAVAYVWL